MNWTGGSRARNGKPTTDTARLQKSYFAKVRARASAPQTPGGRRKTRIPELDIIQNKKRTPSYGPFEGLGLDREEEEGGGGGADIKAKKRRLLEEESWVCTEALARPLGLGGRQADVHVPVRPQGRATPEVLRNPEMFLLDTVVRGGGCEGLLEEVPCSNNSRYSSAGPAGGESRGPRNGVFRNLSDGGFVQIGGESTQCGGSSYGQQRGGSVGRELSDISEETMLFDIGGRQEESSPPMPMMFPRKGSNNIFTRRNGVENVRRDTAFKLGDWSLNRHAHMHGGLPSSPLAPYSQRPREWGLSTPVKRFAGAGRGGGKDILEEIDEAATDIWVSSPFEVLPAKGAQPQATRSIHAHADPPDGTSNGGDLTSLSRLLQQGDSCQTQNESLVACASSGGSSAGEDEGEEWMLGSNIPPPGSSQESTAASDRVTAGEGHEDGWETFLEGHVVSAEEDSRDAHTPGPNELYVPEPDVPEGCADITGGAGRQETQSQDFIESLNLEYREPSVAPLSSRLAHTPVLASNGDTEENWREFVKAPPEKGGPEANGTVDQEEKPPSKTNTSQAGGALLRDTNPCAAAAEEELQIALEFDKDEDNAWRAFVFGGLSEAEAEPEPEQPHRRTTLPLKSSLKPPKAQLPSPGASEALYAPSTAAATAGSAASSEDTSTGSPVARRASRFFGSSPPPVDTVPRAMRPIGWRGRGNLYSGGRGRGRGRGLGASGRGLEVGLAGESVSEDVEDIEDW